ncbi:hypothetical protein B566_EDAN019069, partial [Ephemera danica]
MALSASSGLTSTFRRSDLGTSKVEPALTSMRGGMRLTSRRSASLMPTRCAASAERMVFGATQAVQVASAPWCLFSARAKALALSKGSSTCGVPEARITGLFICGFRPWKSASVSPARRAASATSMSRSIFTLRKYGLKRHCKVIIHTDSEYVRNGITQWIHNWKLRGWKTTDKKPVKNVDLWQQLDAQCQAHAVEWRW